MLAYKENGMGNGSENAKVYLKENPKVTDEIIAKVRAKLAPAPTPLAVTGESLEKEKKSVKKVG